MGELENAILLSIGNGVKSGYQIKRDVESSLGRAVRVGSLYRVLIAMRHAGLIIDADKPADNDDPRRQYFRRREERSNQCPTKPYLT